MPCEIRWKSSLSAACMHAAACRWAGIAPADPPFAATLEAPAQALIDELSVTLWPVDEVLEQLASLSAEFENNRELVTRAVRRLNLSASDAAINAVAGAIADLEAAMRRAAPELAEELALRGGPLRQQWDARGPGLLVEAARLAEPAVVPDFAEVVLVSPYAGGHGAAHPAHNRVTFEAVLANPHAELPETVRLAWLLCQLNGDLPRVADPLPAGRAPAAVRLAVLAPTLAAAEVVELARCDEATVNAALDAWRLRAGLPADAGQRIWSWWQTWLDAPANWPVAVAALEQMLHP